MSQNDEFKNKLTVILWAFRTTAFPEKRLHEYVNEVIDKYSITLRTTAEKYKKIGRAEIENELMCELRDPCGTIWEHAKKLQDENDALKVEIRSVHNRAVELSAHSACDAVHHVSCKPLSVDKKGHYIAKHIRRLKKEASRE